MLVLPVNWVFLKLHESAVAAGVRRIEAVCGKAAEDYINDTISELNISQRTLEKSQRYSKSG